MLRIKILFLCLLMCFSVIACSTKQLRVQEYQVGAGTPNPALPPEEFYVIGPGDSISIEVWKEPTLGGSVTVRPDGYITLPLLNEVQIAGLSTAQLRKLMTEKYKEYTTDPFVTIRVGGIASAEVFFISPGTGKNGAFPLKGNETLLQLITRTGGLGIFSDRSNIRIVRREGDHITEYVVDYDAIINGDLKQDILLRPGDRVIVP